jgi:hypothetical protein
MNNLHSLQSLCIKSILENNISYKQLPLLFHNTIDQLRNSSSIKKLMNNKLEEYNRYNKAIAKRFSTKDILNTFCTYFSLTLNFIVIIISILVEENNIPLIIHLINLMYIFVTYITSILLSNQIDKDIKVRENIIKSISDLNVKKLWKKAEVEGFITNDEINQFNNLI